MVAELGNFALILALCLALVQSVLPLVGARTGSLRLMRTGGFLASGQFVFLAIAYGVLTWAFLASDFSVRYVASHSALSQPLMYKITAVVFALAMAALMGGRLDAAWAAAFTGSPGSRCCWPTTCCSPWPSRRSSSAPSTRWCSTPSAWARSRWAPPYFDTVFAPLMLPLLLLVGLGPMVMWKQASPAEVERDVRMQPGETTAAAGFAFTLLRMEEVRGPNYDADQAVVAVTRDGRPVATLLPQRRYYDTQPQNPMHQASLHRAATRDVYVSLGERLVGDAWSFRL